eukprot:COSAG02_NODE_2193_length_9555_cov_102.183481_12_plen_308_part_01
MMVPQRTAYQLVLACGSFALASAQGVPGTDCCHGTDPANTCYTWFQDAVNVCPSDTMPRDSCDCHEPRDTAGNIALSEGECCRRSCWMAGFTDETCPTGTMARGEHDYHQPGWMQHADGSWGPGEFTEQECCQRTCFTEGFTDATCPDGTMARGEHDWHQPGDGEFTEAECCVRNCWLAGFTDVTCPTGTMARGEHDWHQPGWMQHADGSWGPGEFTEVECCQSNCWTAGYTSRADCPVGHVPRGRDDMHQPGVSGEFTQEECCQRESVPGTDCCHGIDPANTCYTWFQDAGNVCPSDTMPRDSCDCH